jgi:hypothetical protein
MRNYSAIFFHRSFCLCRFHATPCARSSHARADMHAAAGEVDAKLGETSTVPCQCVITQPKIITDHFAFADSMPHHARARPALGGHARRRWTSGCEVGRDDLQVFSFALHPESTVPCQCVITQPIFFTDHFAFADSMPHHARARPMRAWTCTPPLCSRHRHHRDLHWQCATTLQLEARRIVQFTLAKSLPCHVRARPMRARGHARRRRWTCKSLHFNHLRILN